MFYCHIIILLDSLITKLSTKIFVKRGNIFYGTDNKASRGTMRSNEKSKLIYILLQRDHGKQHYYRSVTKINKGCGVLDSLIYYYIAQLLVTFNSKGDNNYQVIWIG